MDVGLTSSRAIWDSQTPSKLINQQSKDSIFKQIWNLLFSCTGGRVPSKKLNPQNLGEARGSRGRIDREISRLAAIQDIAGDVTQRLKPEMITPPAVVTAERYKNMQDLMEKTQSNLESLWNTWNSLYGKMESDDEITFFAKESIPSKKDLVAMGSYYLQNQKLWPKTTWVELKQFNASILTADPKISEKNKAFLILHSLEVGRGAKKIHYLGVDLLSGDIKAISISQDPSLVFTCISKDVAEILTSFSEGGPVALRDVIDFQDNDAVKTQFTVQDFYVRGNLFDYLKSTEGVELTHEEKQLMAISFLTNLEILQVNGLLHGDIKPENILVTEKKCLVLTDFDSTRKKNDDCLTKPIASFPYLPPEVLLTLNADFFNEKGEAWSAGLVLYHLLSNHKSRLVKEIELKGREFKYSVNHFIVWTPTCDENQEGYSEGLKIVRGLLSTDQDERSTVSQALEEINKIQAQEFVIAYS